jgi:hypothetical protein
LLALLRGAKRPKECAARMTGSLRASRTEEKCNVQSVQELIFPDRLK